MTSIALESAPNSRRTGRSVLAVLAGFVTIFVTHNAADAVCHATNVFPAWGERMSDGLFLLALGYRNLFSVLGGYVTARLAPAKPERHALWLGLLGVVICTIALIATWNRTDLGPRWYTALLALSSVPCALAGAKLLRR